jgi:hypothetical protein
MVERFTASQDEGGLRRCRATWRGVRPYSIVKEPFSQRDAWPRSWVGRWGLPVCRFSFRPPNKGGWRAERRMPWISPGRPDGQSGESGSPDPGAHDASARASRRTTAAFSAIGVLRRPDLAGPVVPRRGDPAAARVRGCEPRTRVPRPAPLRTTPRPKRPSVDGTAVTSSESHPECQ